METQRNYKVLLAVFVLQNVQAYSFGIFGSDGLGWSVDSGCACLSHHHTGRHVLSSETHSHSLSLSATVEFSVSYSNISFCSTAHARCGPKMDIYTTQKDVNFKKNCSYDSFGQAGNERLVIYLSELDPSNPIHQTSSKTCTLLPGEYQRVQCSGKVTVQDFIPRNLFISLGYKCKHTSKLAKMPSLYGMQLNISVLNQSNTTACEKIVS